MSKQIWVFQGGVCRQGFKVLWKEWEASRSDTHPAPRHDHWWQSRTGPAGQEKGPTGSKFSSVFYSTPARTCCCGTGNEPSAPLLFLAPCTDSRLRTVFWTTLTCGDMMPPHRTVVPCGPMPHTQPTAGLQAGGTRSQILLSEKSKFKVNM